MKKLVSTLLILVLGPWSIVHSPVFAQTPLNLQTCFELALKQSEKVAIQDTNIQIAEKKYAEAVGAILPNISFKGSESLQDDTGESSSGSAVGSTLTRFSRPELKFNAKQPIFSGFREFHALAAVRAQKRENQATYENAKRLLFLDVAKAFYTVVQLGQDTTIVKDITKVLQNQLNETKTRTRLGKSRLSEEVSTESELAVEQAMLSELEGSLASAKEVLTFFTGEVMDSLVDDFLLPLDVKEENYLSGKSTKRPDVVAAEEFFHVSKSKLAVAKGALLPSINAEANYYPYRVGFQQDIKWDALFTLDVPIFEGGQTRAKIQEAKILLKQSELELSEKKREADLEVKKAYQDFVSSKNQSAAFETAKAKAGQNFKLAEQDYRLGLINNLELLQTLKNLQEMRRNAVRTQLQTKWSYLNLKAAAGEPLP